MLKFKTFAVLAVVAVTTFGTGISRADEAASEAREKVQYHLEKWRTTHAEGKQAEQLVGTLKKLRCEVKVHSHGGHTDVNYRCAKWQTLSLKTHKEAHQWETWLKKYGFQTKHVH